MRRVTGYKDYTTREGDTFDALALEMYGEEMLAHYIAEFNPDYRFCHLLSAKTVGFHLSDPKSQMLHYQGTGHSRHGSR